MTHAEPLEDSLESKGIIQVMDANGEAKAKFDASDLKKVAQLVDNNANDVDSLSEKANDIDDKLGGVTFGLDADGKPTFSYKNGDGDDVTKKMGSNIVQLGGASSYDLTSYAGYKSFTNDNFFLKVNSLHLWIRERNDHTPDNKTKYFDVNPTVSYNPDTGIVSCSNMSINGEVYVASGGASISYTLYLVY